MRRAFTFTMLSLSALLFFANGAQAYSGQPKSVQVTVFDKATVISLPEITAEKGSCSAPLFGLLALAFDHREITFDPGAYVIKIGSENFHLVRLDVENECPGDLTQLSDGDLSGVVGSKWPSITRVQDLVFLGDSGRYFSLYAQPPEGSPVKYLGSMWNSRTDGDMPLGIEVESRYPAIYP